jgi:hypothetical protein
VRAAPNLNTHPAIIAGVLLCGLVHAATAGTVQLNNGDRITGRMISLEAGTLLTETAYAGRVKIQWDAVTAVTTDEPMLVEHDGHPNGLRTKLAAHAPGSAVTDANEVIALSSITRMSQPPSPGSSSWHTEGIADVSADIKRETNDSTDHAASFNVRTESDTWRHIVSGDYSRASLNSVTTSHHWELGYKLDRLLGEQFFLRSSLLRRDDAFATIARQRGLGLGVGYRFAEEDAERLDLTAGLARIGFDLRATEERVNVVLLQWDYRKRLFSSSLEVFTDGGLAVPNVDGVQHLASGKLGLRYQLNSWVHFSSQLEFDSIKVEGERLRDEHYVLGLGVSW